MPTSQISLKSFGRMVRRKRGKNGLRPAAAEIGISFTALTRMENARAVPQLETLKKVCVWLGVDPGPYIGALIGSPYIPQTAQKPSAQVVFPKGQSLTLKTAQALSTMILAAHREFTSIKADGH
jgi:transcriptional regulator with XRE-family HTH domain